MARSGSLQSNFLGGEWSPFSQGRVDLPQYKTALQTCVNAYPLEEGCWVRRPGTAMGGFSYQGNPAIKMIPFDLTGSLPVQIEFVPGRARFWWAKQLMYDFSENISQLLPVGQSGNTAVAVLLQANPLDPKPGAAPGSFVFANGTEVQLVPLDAVAKMAMPKICLGRTFILQSTGNNSLWNLIDGVSGFSVTDADILGWQSGYNVQIQRVSSIPVPYGFVQDIPNIRLVQTEMQGTLLCKGYAPQVLVATPIASSPLNLAQFVPGPNSLYFTISQATFIDGPYLDPPPLGRAVTGCNITPGFDPSVSQPPVGPFSVNITVPGGATAPNNGLGFLATDVGRQIRVFIEPPDYSPTAVYGSAPPQPSVVKYNNSYWICVAANPVNGVPIQISGKTPGELPPTTNQTQTQIGVTGPNLTQTTTVAIELIFWVAIPTSQAAWWFTGTINQIVNNLSVNATFQVTGNTAVFPFPIQVSNQSQISTPYTYQLGAYSATTGYPTSGCYHEGRLWLGGAIPNRIDGSIIKGAFGPNYNPVTYWNLNTSALPTSELYIFSPSDFNGNVLASNAIAATLQDAQSNQIFWMQPTLTGIVVGTQGGEWLVQGAAQNAVMTPTSIQAHKMTLYGCANVEPRRTGLTTVFVQKLGRRVLEYLADVFSGKFYGPNLSEYARHITYPGIVELAYQEEQTPTIWARRSDGNAVACTYRRVAMFSTQDPKFMGWHRHVFGNTGTNFVEAISVGSDPLGTSQSACIAIAAASQYKTANTGVVTFMTQQQEPAMGLGNAWYVDFGVVPTFVSLAVVNNQQGLLLNGLWLHEKQTRTAWIAGLDAGDWLCSGGQMFVPFYNGGANGQQNVNFTLPGITNISASIPAGNPLNPIQPVVASSPQAVPTNFGAPYVQAVVGETYTSTGQRLRDIDPQSLGQPTGPGLGKKRRPHIVAMLFDGIVSGSVSVFTDATGVVPARPILLTAANRQPLDNTQLYSGVWFDAIQAESDFEGQVGWTITRPYPCEVMAVETYQVAQDR